MTETPQCEYGTPVAGNVNQERCEQKGTKTYHVLDDETIDLCEEHYEQFHRGDYLSGAGDW